MRRGEIRRGSSTALVTGASSGIGRAIALRLGALGYDLVLVSVNEPALAAAATQIAGRSGARVRYRAFDLAVPDAAHRLYAWCTEQGIEVDLLVNDAGAFCFRDILACPTSRIETLVNLHAMTPSLTCRLFGEGMAQRGRGWILNLSSYSVWMPLPGLALYSASKAYLKCFSRAFAKEVREKGVTVTAVCPAGVATDLYGLPARWQRIGVRLGVLITPDKCARLALDALWRGRKVYVPAAWFRIFIPLLSALPRPLTDLVRRRTMRFQK